MTAKTMDAAALSAAMVLRREWAMDRYKAGCVRFLAVAALLALSVVGNVAHLGDRRDNVYLVADEDGRLVDMVPISRPNMADEDVAAWTVSAITDLMSFDFANYRGQLQDARYDLTGRGWRSFEEMLSDGASGIATAVLRNKFVVTTVPTGPARVAEKGVLTTERGSRFVWTVEVPVLLSYRSDRREIETDLMMRVTVIRMPEFVHEDGLGIRAVVGV